MPENALLPVAEKLGKLLPVLSSNRDGEVVAAVRAIGRTLAGAGRDWRDLARAVAEPPPPRIVFVERAPAWHEPGNWQDLARWCRDNDGSRLKPHERAFVADMAARLVCGGEPTDKQGAWLRALYAKLRRAA